MTVAKFVEGSTLRHISVMSSTAAIGLMTLFVVDLVDMFFLSLLGEQELAAAVGYSGTILFFTTSVNIGIAIAMGALVARALGERKVPRSRRHVVNVTTFLWLFNVPVAAIVWFGIPIWLSWLGAEGRAAELAELYLRILIPTMPLLGMGMAAGGVLRAHGAAKLAMMTTVAGGLVNAILDPILIFGFDMGIAGAAWASVAARAAVLLAGLYGMRKVVPSLPAFSIKSFRAGLSNITAIAFPAMATNIATPIGNAYVTASVSEFGDAAVAGYSVIGRLVPVAFGFIYALSGAVGPVIGQNYGAKRIDRVRQSLWDSLLLTGLVVGFSSLIMFIFQDWISHVFNASEDAALLIGFFCTYVAFSFAFNGAQFCANAAFNNLGKPIWSTVSNWGKNTIGTFPFVAVGAAWGGAEGVLMGQAAGGIVFGTGAMIAAFWWIRKLEENNYPQPKESWRARFFRMPLSAYTVYRGWMGGFEQDDPPKQKRDP